MQDSLATLLNLLTIPGASGQEHDLAHHLHTSLLSMGVHTADMWHDHAQDQSEYGGTTGNLIVRFRRKGNHPGASRLFLAHLDAVALCLGAQPRHVQADAHGPERIVNDNPASALGGDCRTGVAVLLHIARELLAAESHPPVWLVFPVQEEVGLVGSRGLDLAALNPDPPVMGFNMDSENTVDTMITAVTGTTRFFMELHGRATHAGINPEGGVSTIAAASLALADLVRDGWHGRITKPGGCGSANIGIIQGGAMTNSVMYKLIVRGEARSHDPAFRQRIVNRYRSVFTQAAADTCGADGTSARLEWTLGPCYESFALDRESPVVQAAAAAMRQVRLTPKYDDHDDGGSDANWINAHGVPMVTLSTGMREVHTIKEWIDLDDFFISCQLATAIATSY